MTRRQHIVAISCLILLALFGVYWYVSTPDVAKVPMAKMVGEQPAPVLSEIRAEGFPTIEISKIVGWPKGKTPVAAPGLKVAAFASSMAHPRWLFQLPNGDVLAAQSNAPARETHGLTDWFARKLIAKSNGGTDSPDQIILLRDANKDGVAEERHVLLDRGNGMHSPFGMALLDGKLFVANTDALIAFPYKDGETKIEGKGEKVVDLPASAPNNHWARNVIVAQDGKSLYVTVGSNSNIGENGMENETERAAIWQVDPVKKTHIIFAYGLRNPNGLALNPKSKLLWTVVNERDQLGSDGPADYLTTVDFGTFYGWPYYYWGKHQDGRVMQNRLDLEPYSKRPDYALGPHVAPLGLAFAKDATLGANWASGAFVGLHGSWNRSPVSGYKVVYVPFNARNFSQGAPVDVLTGFLDGQGNAYGRPAGVIILSDGTLLVADDSGNTIWRVSAAGSVAGK
jgi:glucose/arabinose dehydrogenase